MRIALFTDGISPYVLGGMQRHSYFICKYLAQNGIKVDLYHTNQSSLDITKLDVFTEEEKKNINSIVINFPSPGKIPGHYVRNSYEYSKRIYNEYIKQEPVDFIYTKGFTGWYLLEQRAKGKISAPKIGVKFHGYEMFQYQPNFKASLSSNLFLKRPVRKISKWSDFIFSYGGKITELISLSGVNQSKIIEIPSGISKDLTRDEVTSLNTPIRFCFVGRPERRKGIIELNKVITALSNSNRKHEFEFKFIGPIEDNQKLKLENVSYEGEIRNHITLLNLLDKCDVLVCPSYSEGMPNVILEAMSRSCAIIASDVGAISMMVNPENGILIKPGDTSELKSAIEQILSNKEKLNSLKASSLKKCKEDFIWENIMEKLIRVLDKITISG